MVDQNFTDALAALVAAVKANAVPDQAAIDAAVAASKAEDLQAVTDLTAAQAPPVVAEPVAEAPVAPIE